MLEEFTTPFWSFPACRSPCPPVATSLLLAGALLEIPLPITSARLALPTQWCLSASNSLLAQHGSGGPVGAIRVQESQELRNTTPACLRCWKRKRGQATGFSRAGSSIASRTTHGGALRGAHGQMLGLAVCGEPAEIKERVPHQHGLMKGGGSCLRTAMSPIAVTMRCRIARSRGAKISRLRKSPHSGERADRWR